MSSEIGTTWAELSWADFLRAELSCANLSLSGDLPLETRR